MTPTEYWNATSHANIERMCKRAGTSVDNFKKIALYGGSCSAKLAARLAVASRKAMTEMHILYPERY